MDLKPVLTVGISLALSLPMALSDAKTYSVNPWWLAALGAAALGLDWWRQDETLLIRLLFSAIVFLIGSAAWLLVRDRLGYADILYLTALALLFPIWHWVLIVGLATVAGMMFFGYSFLKDRDTRMIPLPFVTVLFAALCGVGVRLCWQSVF